MEEKLKKLIVEMFDSGMTLDEIIEMVSNIASKEDFRRFKGNENETE